MTKEIKNIGFSIKTKLWKIASENKRDKNDNQIYQLSTVRYIQERLLYRLCRSRFCDKFYLKEEHCCLRTRNSTHGRQWILISSDIISVVALRRLNQCLPRLTADIVEEGISFDAGQITAEEKTVNKEYHGVQLTLPARIDTII